MRMLSKAVGKQHSRRFAFAAAGAACRTTTYLFISVRARYGHTTVRSSTTTFDGGLRRVSCDGGRAPAGPNARFLGSRHDEKEV
jgi:hypothetical protein